MHVVTTVLVLFRDQHSMQCSAVQCSGRASARVVTDIGGDTSDSVLGVVALSFIPSVTYILDPLRAA